jgi:type II secretory pathway component PulM
MSTFANLRGNLRDSTTRVVTRPFTYLAAEWERMAPRERRSVAALAVAVVVVAVLLSGYFIFSSISDSQDENGKIREALTAIAKHRDEYLEAKGRSATVDARIGSEPPQLIADIEAAAREESVQIAETNERPTSPAGRRYTEHDVDIKMREVDLQSLTRFLRRVETGPRLIFFTRLTIKRRYSETDKLDVEATATAFEKVREDKTKKKPDGSGPAPGKGK